MTPENARKIIEQGEATLGIELGSTRIKAVLIAPDYTSIATGSHNWENKLVDGIWTYGLEDVWTGLSSCFQSLSNEVMKKYSSPLKKISGIGISAMMHGYLVFGKNHKLLTPFRTWRNTITEQAAAELTSLFDFNIPQRWSIAHLYQAILNKEAHVQEIDFMTTLAGYVHWKLTGNKVLGIGDASGVFPIDSNMNDYDQHMIQQIDGLLSSSHIPWRLRDILPNVLPAGVEGGILTEEGARLLDPYGALEAGIPLCPPEGDAGTGMVATNSVTVRTGNVSAGTSVFAMIVLDKPLDHIYTEIDMVTTPAGKPVAMVHCNNCSTDLDAWIALFEETIETFGFKVEKATLYEKLLNAAANADSDCSGILSYNYYSGEPITMLDGGRPLLLRSPNSKFTLGNVMRAHLYSAVATLKIGMDILFQKEKVVVDRLLGHGGFFKTTDMGQRVMAAAMGTNVDVMETAGEGGAWGIALLAAFMKSNNHQQSLDAYLTNNVFSNAQVKHLSPISSDTEGFTTFLERYQACLPLENIALEKLK